MSRANPPLIPSQRPPHHQLAVGEKTRPPLVFRRRTDGETECCTRSGPAPPPPSAAATCRPVSRQRPAPTLSARQAQAEPSLARARSLPPHGLPEPRPHAGSPCRRAAPCRRELAAPAARWPPPPQALAVRRSSTRLPLKDAVTAGISWSVGRRRPPLGCCPMDVLAHTPTSAGLSWSAGRRCRRLPPHAAHWGPSP